MAEGDIDSGQPRMFDLNRPQGYAKDDYLYQWKVSYDVVFDIIRRNNNNKNPMDLIIACQFAISLIAHDDVRRRQETLFHAAIDYINSANALSDEQLAGEVARICEDQSMTTEIKSTNIIRLFRNKRMTADEKVNETLRVCAITMGALTAYVDQFRGLAHTLKVGELINQEKPYAKRTSAFKPVSDDTIEL